VPNCLPFSVLVNIGSIIIFCFVDAMCFTNSLTWNHGRFTGVYLWLYVCLPLLSRSYVFLYCCWRLWKHKTVCRSYTRCNIDSRAPAQESKLRQPQALQQVMWRPGPGQQSQCLQVCHPTRTGTTLSWQAQLLPWVAWVGIYCQSLRSRRRLSTEEVGCECDLWMVGLIFHHGLLSAHRPAPSRNNCWNVLYTTCSEACCITEPWSMHSRRSVVLSLAWQVAMLSDACNAAYILQERFLGTDVLNVNLLPLSFISAHMAKCILW